MAYKLPNDYSATLNFKWQYLDYLFQSLQNILIQQLNAITASWSAWQVHNSIMTEWVYHICVFMYLRILFKRI